MKFRSLLFASSLNLLTAAPAFAQTYPSPTYSSVTLSNGTSAQSIQTALPTAATPWQALPSVSLYLGRTQAAIPGDSDYGQTYLGQPYGPETNGVEIDGGVERILSTTYGWSGAGGNDNLLVVNSEDSGTGADRMRGIQNYNGYSSRLSYGEGDSHTVYFGNRGRSVDLTLTGLTAANFTTDPALIDPTTGSPVYRISFSAGNAPGGVVPSSSIMASLVPGDMVFTSNGFFALIIKADPNGNWIDVDNWTRGAANITHNGACANHGPSVQPSASADSGCTQDIEAGGATSLTAYVGTETTFEPIQISSALLPSVINPLTDVVGGMEVTLLNDSYTMPVWNDANPGLDLPLLTGIGGGVQAENSGTVPGSDGVGVWGNGEYWSNAVRRAYVVATTNANGPYPMQPLCGLCVIQGSTVQNGYENDESLTTGTYALLSKTGNAGPVTASIDKLGNATFTGLTLTPPNVGSQSSSSFSGRSMQFAWNYTGGQGEEDLFIPEVAGLPSGFYVYPVTSAGVANAPSSPIFKLNETGNLTIAGQFNSAAPPAESPNVVVPTSGSTVTIPKISGDTILNPPGPLASLTLVIPLPAQDGATIRVVALQQITSLSVTSTLSLQGAPLSMAADTSFTMEFSSVVGRWFRIDKSS